MYKVCIIDDEPWSRVVVKSMGQWEALKMVVVCEAEDGSEGLRMIEELQPDIVITDMRMPGIDGVELLKSVNERFPGIRLIVMSGYDDFVFLKQAIRSKAVEYLLKPVDPDELNTALQKSVEEIERDRLKVSALWETTPLFADQHTLEQYLSYRQQVGRFMRELNRTAVHKTLEQLQAFIETDLCEDKNKKLLQRIGLDFVMILEEFLAESESGLAHLWNEKNYDWAQEGWKTMMDVTAEINWLYEKAMDAVEDILRNKNRLDMSAIQNYINRHFQEAITLDTIAQRFFVSKEHLSRAFKATFGENMTDVIVAKRMEAAQELIREQKMAIKTVAHMMGYDDVAYFHKVFRKYFGVTPGEMRKGKGESIFYNRGC